MAFIVYATQRSGTVLLSTALDSHSRLTCFPEVQRFFDRSTPARKRFPEIKCRIEEILKGKFEDHTMWDLISRLGAREGVNIKYDQIGNDVEEMHIEKNKVIHLIRQNLLDVAISKYLNGISSRWNLASHIYKGTDEYPAHSSLKYNTPSDTTKEHFLQNRPSRVHVEPLVIRRLVEETKSAVMLNMQRLKPYGDRVLTVFYEDLVLDTFEVHEIEQEAGKKICKFLNVEYEPLRSGTLKTNYTKHEDFIENFHELRELRDLLPRSGL